MNKQHPLKAGAFGQPRGSFFADNLDSYAQYASIPLADDCLNDGHGTGIPAGSILICRILPVQEAIANLARYTGKTMVFSMNRGGSWRNIVGRLRSVHADSGFIRLSYPNPQHLDKALDLQELQGAMIVEQVSVNFNGAWFTSSFKTPIHV